MKEIKMQCNAKINLFLNIVGVKDGYHLLNSLFVPISLFDDIIISNSNRDEIVGLDIPMEDNIIYKTICLIRKNYQIEQKVKVIIDKKIPIMAGLGGGSSNAAAVIVGLNKLWNLNLNDEIVQKISERIGNDVFFFIKNETSYVRGFGQIITKVEKKSVKGILVFDDIFFSTKEMFNMYDCLKISYKKDYVNIGDVKDFGNDFEMVLPYINKGDKIIKIKNDLLKYGAYKSNMSGSGSSVFGLFDDEKKREIAYNNLKNKYKKVYMFENIK